MDSVAAHIKSDISQGIRSRCQSFTPFEEEWIEVQMQPLDEKQFVNIWINPQLTKCIGLHWLNSLCSAIFEKYGISTYALNCI